MIVRNEEALQPKASNERYYYFSVIIDRNTKNYWICDIRGQAALYGIRTLK